MGYIEYCILSREVEERNHGFKNRNWLIFVKENA
jgi:hypothetical protein